MDETFELHRLTGPAAAAAFAGASGFVARLTPGAALTFSGEAVADLNMMFLFGAPAEAETFLAEGMAIADARSLPLLVLISPVIAGALAPAAERHGLTRAGSLPLMVLKGAPSNPPRREARIEAATTPKLARIAGDLVAAAFSLPREAVARVIDSGVTAHGAAATYAAFDGEAPMSSVAITRTGATAGVWNMATAPEHQGKGVGRALLFGVIERLRADGVERFYLYATAAGRPLYESLGFVTLAEDAVWVKGHSTQAA